ncbi:hypothetical protein [Mycolicibacterium sp. P9-64]|uniref:hypothetical protein n=1 Tax=Mycolicibacterium sp. P9-64 TaxID=2024612 RepID=UPI001F5BF23F|nr:hypothetical protein [Mycolicibacterium sp. P9-64]
MRMTIKSSNQVTAVAWAMAAGAAISLAVASPAAANDPILPRAGDGPADVAIQQLQAAGYTVSVNWLEGHPNVPLRECKVTGISGLDGSTPPKGFATVYVDVSCPNAK